MVTLDEYLEKYRELSKKVKRENHYTVTLVIEGGEYSPQTIVMRLVFPFYFSFSEVRKGAINYAERRFEGSIRIASIRVYYGAGDGKKKGKKKG